MQLRDFLPDLPHGTLSASLTKLRKAGKVDRVSQSMRGKGRGARNFAYMLTPPALTPAPRPDPTPTAADVTPPTVGLQALLDKATADLETIKHWQAEAIVRFPDLAVDQMMLKARRFAAARQTGPVQDDILAGRLDDKPAVLAVLDALKELAS